MDIDLDKFCLDGKPHTWWKDMDGDLECLKCGEIQEKKTPPKRGKDRQPRRVGFDDQGEI
jgi:hypothetical protein